MIYDKLVDNYFPLMDKVEKKLLNFVCPKSVILYAEKRARVAA